MGQLHEQNHSETPEHEEKVEAFLEDDYNIPHHNYWVTMTLQKRTDAIIFSFSDGGPRWPSGFGR